MSQKISLKKMKMDKAIGMSKWLHSYNRAGFTPPVCIVEQINTIEVEEDIKKLIKFNLDANNRMETLKLQKATTAHRYWKLQAT